MKEITNERNTTMATTPGILHPLTDSQVMLLWEEAFTLSKKSAPESNILTYRMLIPEGNPDALEKAWNKLLETNDSLRIRLLRLPRWSPETKGDYPTIRIAAYRLWLRGLRQEIAPYEPQSLTVTDLPDRAAFERFFNTFRDGSLMLLGGPLHYAELVRIADGTIALIARFHHVIIDGYSFKLLFERIAEAYESLLKGEEPNLTVRSVIPAFEESGRYLTSPRLEKDRTYWKDAYHTQPRFCFPAGRTPLNSTAFTVTQTIRDPLYHRAAELARTLGPGCSTYALLVFIAAFTIYRITGRTNFALHHMSHGRQDAAARETIGAMINMFPVFFDLNPGATFREELAKARNAYLEALFHGRLSFNDLLMYTFREALRNGFILNQAWMVLNNEDFAASVASTPYEAESFGARNQPHQFFCQLLENPGESLELSLRVQTKKYGEDQARDFLRLFLETLEAVLKDPDRPLSSLGNSGRKTNKKPRNK